MTKIDNMLKNIIGKKKTNNIISRFSFKNQTMPNLQMPKIQMSKMLFKQSIIRDNSKNMAVTNWSKKDVNEHNKFLKEDNRFFKGKGRSNLIFEDYGNPRGVFTVVIKHPKKEDEYRNLRMGEYDSIEDKRNIIKQVSEKYGKDIKIIEEGGHEYYLDDEEELKPNQKPVKDIGKNMAFKKLKVETPTDWPDDPDKYPPMRPGFGRQTIVQKVPERANEKFQNINVYDEGSSFEVFADDKISDIELRQKAKNYYEQTMKDTGSTKKEIKKYSKYLNI